MGVDLANIVDYQYKLYSDYLDQVDDVLIRRGQYSGLSIEYWHIRVDLSKNFDEILRMQNSYKHFVYDLYHFIPTINATPLTYQIGFQQQSQGTTNQAVGTFSLYLIDDPLPGDLFRFYPYDGTTERTEVFRVLNVRYIRTSKNKLKLFEIEFETAPFYITSLEHVRINEIRCWDTENFRFLSEAECNAMNEIIDSRDKIIDKINKWYDPVNGWYGLCPDFETGDINCGPGKTTRPLVFLNTILKRIKKLYPALDIKPIFGIGTAKIPIAWGMPKVPVWEDPLQPPVYKYQDWWDTFTCLSFNQGNEGEIFNVTKILQGECVACPEELVQEITCHKELVEAVQELTMLYQPILTQEQMYDKTCDRRCCDALDPNYVVTCIKDGKIPQENFGEIFWDYTGPNAARLSPPCEDIGASDKPCIPLYISWQQGAVWAQGGLTP